MPRLAFGLPYSAVPAAAMCAALGPSPALAVGAGAHAGASETILIAQIVVLLAAGRLLGEAMQRMGQPAVMGQLIAGLLLGPSLLGWVWPGAEHALFPNDETQKAMLAGVAQLGVLLLLLLTGMETDLKLVRHVGRASIVIAATGLAVPFACGFGLGQILPDQVLPRPELRLVTSLFLGVALSISSVKIVAMVVRDLHFMRRNIGQIIVAAAIIEDTIGWIVIALVLGIALSGHFDVLAFTKTLLGTAMFLALSFSLGRRIVARLIRWSNDNLVSELGVVTTILVIMGLMALASDAIGVHSVLGAFVAGMLVGQSPILTGHIDEQLRGLITALFMPVFFAVAGLGADLTVLLDPRMLALTCGLVAIASVGKFAGAFLGSRLGGLGRAEAFAIGAGMNARGSTEVIVASIGLSMGALSQDLYTMIVAMAVLTTLAMPPTLRWALLRLPMGEAERARLEREERDRDGFVAKFERLLLTVDDSPSSRFAAHVAGLIAGPRQILTTVLKLRDSPAGAATGVTGLTASDDAVVAAVRTAAEAAQSNLPPEEAAEQPLDVTARKAKTPIEADAVEQEARKGYDLMMIGLEPTCVGAGMIAPRVAEVAATFDGALAIIDARGRHERVPTPQSLSILLPIRASGHAQRAAEVAVEIARACRAPVEAMFVADGPRRSWRNPAAMAAGLEEDAALKHVVTLANSHGVRISTSVHRRGDTAAAIRQQAACMDHDLIVLGVSRRPGDELFFGKVAAEVLAGASCSILLVSS